MATLLVVLSVEFEVIDFIQVAASLERGRCTLKCIASLKYLYSLPMACNVVMLPML